MMAKRKLTTFGFDEELISKFNQAGFSLTEDLFSQSFLHLMTVLRLSASETEELLSIASSASLPILVKASDLLNEEKFTIEFGYSQLDKLLYSGVKRRTLTELTGPPGVGKTQMCLHLALNFLQKSNLMKSICIIDIEGTFTTDRLIELIQHNHNFEDKEEEAIEKVFVLKLKSSDTFAEVLNSLETLCIDKEVGLLIVDSVASLSRKEFSFDSGLRRGIALATWAAQLKKIADACQLAVLVTNQVTSRLCTSEYNSKEEDSLYDINTNMTRYQTNPSLGTAWTHYVNTRIILQFLDDHKRQLIVAKSPVCPVATVNYLIRPAGIQFEGELSYTLSGMDSSKQQILVRPGIES